MASELSHIWCLTLGLQFVAENRDSLGLWKADRGGIGIKLFGIVFNRVGL